MGNPSIKETIYASVLKDILDGAYPQDAVINEKTLMEEFGVSKAPVREALVQLCSEGFIKNIPRFGYQLVSITPSEIVEMVEYRKVIELGALERAAERITKDESKFSQETVQLLRQPLSGQGTGCLA